MPLLNDHSQNAAKNGVEPQGVYKSASNAKALTDSLHDVNVSPLWAQMARLNPELPNPTTKPFLWAYDTIRPYLLDSGRLITEKQAERRVLMLTNPERRTTLLYFSSIAWNRSETDTMRRSPIYNRHSIRRSSGGNAKRDCPSAPSLCFCRALYY